MSAAVSGYRLRRGLYAITVETADSALLCRQVAAALAGGVAILQYRDKSTDSARRLSQARALQAECARYRVPLIINDDVDLALAVDAAGVHLGGSDGDLADARRRLGPQRLIGASCYADLARARAAVAAGADYVAFGAFFPSSTKPAAGRAGIELLRAARAELTVPVCAIGGIRHDNAAPLVDAGADWLAVISDLFGAADIRARAGVFAALYAAPRNAFSATSGAAGGQLRADGAVPVSPLSSDTTS